MEHTLIYGLGELAKIALVSPVVRTAVPSEQLTKCGITSYRVKVTEATRTTPDTRKQSQNQLQWLISPIGHLGGESDLLQSFLEMASLEQLKEQGKTTEWSYFLVQELYVIIKQHITCK